MNIGLRYDHSWTEASMVYKTLNSIVKLGVMCIREKRKPDINNKIYNNDLINILSILTTGVVGKHFAL